MSHFEFSYTEAHRSLLLDYLASREGAYNLGQIEGYLFAQICSPNAIEIETWLAEVTAGDTAISEDVIFALMALHHQISEQVYSGHFTLNWQPHIDYAMCHSWSQGFLLAVTPYYEALLGATEVSAELKQALQMSTEQLGFFSLEESQVLDYCQKTSLNSRDFMAQQIELASEFATGYAQLIEAAAVSSGLFDEEDSF